MFKIFENKDLGLLVLRLGVGVMFFFVHGLPKIQGGPDMWVKVGGAMGYFGITFMPVFWGFMAAVSECVGGLLLALGIGTRLVSAFMAFTMLVASTHHLVSGDGLAKASHPIELGFVFFALIWIGSGKYALKPSK